MFELLENARVENARVESWARTKLALLGLVTTSSPALSFVVDLMKLLELTLRK